MKKHRDKAKRVQLKYEAKCVKNTEEVGSKAFGQAHDIGQRPMERQLGAPDQNSRGL